MMGMKLNHMNSQWQPHESPCIPTSNSLRIPSMTSLTILKKTENRGRIILNFL